MRLYKVNDLKKKHILAKQVGLFPTCPEGPVATEWYVIKYIKHVVSMVSRCLMPFH
jgi:hypothetical protein